MVEGWIEDDYVILFADAEIAGASLRYDIASAIAGFEIVGVRSWDHFIVRDTDGKTYLVPVVPMDQRCLSTFDQHLTEGDLRGDDRFRNRIKWLTKPLVFGGDPASAENVSWVSHEQHSALVTWWNEQYRKLRPEIAAG